MVRLSSSDEDRLRTLEDHADKAWRQIDGLSRQVETLAEVQRGQSEKLDAIRQALTRYDSRPAFEPARLLSMGKDALQICAVIAALSVWLILTLTGAEDRVTEIRVRSLETRVDQIRSDQLDDLRASRRTTWELKQDKK